MRLSDFYGSIGLSPIMGDRRKMNKILRLASFSPDFLYEKEEDKKGRIYFDRFKYLGSGFGVSVHGYRAIKSDKEGQPVEKHTVMDWGIFAYGKKNLDVSNVFVDYDSQKTAYCFAQDADSANDLEFRIYNGLELLDAYQKPKDSKGIDELEQSIGSVNIATLMLFGTVILPICKNRDTLLVKEKEKELQKELVLRARLGDPEAKDSLYNMAMERDIDLKKRLRNEDLLSVFDGYFLKLEEEKAIFTILGDILDIDEIINEASGEKLFRMEISMADIVSTIYINKNDLIGHPSVGMRLMGVGLLQGSVGFGNS